MAHGKTPSFIRTAFPEIHPAAERLVLEAWQRVRARPPDGSPSPWERVEAVQACNVARVLRAFHEVGASAGFLDGSTGYGYDDPGRHALEAAYARLFGGEAALVRPQLVSGTHALACALFGVLRPGDRLVVATGPPYDTLWPVLGLEDPHPEPKPAPLDEKEAPPPGPAGIQPARSAGPATGKPRGSLAEWGVEVEVVPLRSDGRVDREALVARLARPTRMVLVQRSRGYSWRPSLSVEEIGEICSAVRRRCPQAVVLVDNAYGEFAQTVEPGEVGADLVAGSLIKNPGGGLAPSGGYLVGRKELVEQAAARLTAPGLAAEVGPSLGVGRWLWMGLFLAPQVVGEALAGAILAAAAFQMAGFEVSPAPDEVRVDTVQAVRAGSEAAAMAIVTGIQRASALDARARPHPARLPGYRDPIVMAGGTFVQGSSSELSADLPLRPPYDVYIQGGLSRFHAAVGAAKALDELVRVGIWRP